MKAALRSVVVATLAVVATLLAMPGTASAAAPPVGYDVSYPQCGTSLPRDRDFAVVGVNGGLSTRGNPCLAAQLTWAWDSSGAVAAQPRAQLYLNTAACSWEYGWERTQNSIDAFFTPAARTARVDGRIGSYTWWLDVETMNTWQSGSTDALERNRATLEGMAAYLLADGGQVGIYSTGQQWAQIVGTVPATSTLAGRDSWLAGGSSPADALAACQDPALVPGGQVALAQYVHGDLDRNRSCS